MSKFYSAFQINDLFVDLADGKYLMRLLEIISGEKLGKPNAGKMRVHKIENVNKCLAFLHTKVKRISLKRVATLHIGSILASHLAALGLIPGAPENVSLEFVDVAGIY